MGDLFGVLGYQASIKKLTDGLEDASGIQLITGPPGVGKSWLAKEIGRQWQEAGGVALVALGDSGRAASPLYPFGYALGSLLRGWRAAVPVVADAGRIAEAVVGTRGAVTATVERLAGLRTGRQRRRSHFLGEAAQNALHNLEHQGKKKPIILIADNLHWWDSASLDLLRMLLGEELQDAYPFLRRLRIIGVETLPQYQPVSNATPHAGLLAAGLARTVELGRAPRARFRDVLLALGAPENLSAATSDEIYTLSGGHLVLAKRAAEYMASRNVDALLSATDAEEFRRVLLDERLHSMGNVGREASELLQIASILGLTFRHDEILCAYAGDEENARRLLRRCRDEEVIEVDQQSYRFVHDIFRQFFGTKTATDVVTIHERLMSCLRVLQPSDYQARCLNAINAERTTEAGVLAVHAVLQASRDADASAESVPEPMRRAIVTAGLDGPLSLLLKAGELLKKYDFAGCLTTLDRLPRGSGRTLMAEADYLRAMCLMSTRSEVDRQRGRDLLRPWAGLEDDEPELGLRLMRQLLYGLAMMCDKSEARQLEQRLRMALESRTGFDPRAVDDIYSLDRCAGSLDPPDLALIRTDEAQRHFGPSGDQTVVRRPLEYYRSLVNYGANLICNARYGDAAAVHDRLSQLLDDYEPGTFPRVDYAYANQLLADYRAGSVTADQAVKRQRDVIARHGNPDDPFYLGNGLGVYLALAGDSAEAIDLFAELRRGLATRRDPEPSMLYLLGSNEICARFLAGDDSDPARRWQEIAPLLEEMAYTTTPYLRRRHTLLSTAFGLPDVLSPDDFDRYVISRHPYEFGPLWDNYGRGFRMPEVEFWREN